MSFKNTSYFGLKPVFRHQNDSFKRSELATDPHRRTQTNKFKLTGNWELIDVG